VWCVCVVCSVVCVCMCCVCVVFVWCVCVCVSRPGTLVLGNSKIKIEYKCEVLLRTP